MCRVFIRPSLHYSEDYQDPCTLAVCSLSIYIHHVYSVCMCHGEIVIKARLDSVFLRVLVKHVHVSDLRHEAQESHVHSSNKAWIMPVTFFLPLSLCVSLTLLRRTGVPLSERDCTDVNSILLMLSATPDTSASEATGSVDGSVAKIFRSGSRQSGSGFIYYCVSLG